MFSFLKIMRKIIFWIPFCNIAIRIISQFLPKDDKYYKDISGEFSDLFTESMSKAFVDFIEQRTLKDLIYLQLECKDRPELPRKSQFLNNVVHQRIHSTIIIISIVALIISLASFFLTISN